MRFVLIAVLLLAGCNETTATLPGVPEVVLLNAAYATVAVQPDGQRLVTILDPNGYVRATVLLPPFPDSKTLKVEETK